MNYVIKLIFAMIDRKFSTNAKAAVKNYRICEKRQHDYVPKGPLSVKLGTQSPSLPDSIHDAWFRSRKDPVRIRTNGVFYSVSLSVYTDFVPFGALCGYYASYTN